jgi:hypothetical protein
MAMESSMLSTSPGFITYSGAPNEEEFTHIRENFGDPRANVKPDDYYSFRMIASGDGLDSYFTRQDVETSFRNFVRDLRKGQSILGSHQMATFSYGSSYGGEIVPADVDRAEYESTFYPQWDTPDLRTKNWLVGQYFIPRGLELNNQKTDMLIRSLETGAVRKASISFMVGQYVCGLDGHDLINTQFGPMPDDACTHFPGVSYEGSVGWALMKNNTLVETSLVYKNASPSSMLLRKAETLAERGVLSGRDITTLESRFAIRLPTFQQRVWVPDPSTNDTTVPSDTGMEDSDMAGKRRSSDAATALAREALIADPEPEQEDAPIVEGESEDISAAPEAAPEAPEPVSESADPDPEPVVQDETPETPDAPEAPAPEEAADDAPAAEEPAEASEPVSESVADAVVSESPEAAEPVVEDSAVEEDKDEPKSESAPEVDVISAFVTAAERLTNAIRRNPDAFGSTDLDYVARAEKAVDLALIDGGCETTVGAHVARSFETRSKALTTTLGEPLTVEAIRNLQSKASLGDTLYEELVKDAVAARTGAQGESFNSAKYRDLLMTARDVVYVKEEIESYKGAKSGTFQAGRSVVPRQVSDVRTTRDERKTLPEAPAALPANGRSAAQSMSILEPRKK